MSRSVEASGPDVDSAIAEALAELKAERDQVEVEILEQPVRRLLGLGVRPARVRVTLQGEGGANVGVLREAPAITSVPSPSVPRAVTSAAPVAPPPEVESEAEHEEKPVPVKKMMAQADA